MTELKNEFNVAAGGPDDQPAAVESTSPIDLNGGAAVEAVEPYTEEEWSTREVSNETYQEIETSDVAARADENVLPASPRVPSIEEAEAELAQLEGRRAEPKAQDNLPPPKKFAKAVQFKVAREHEVRISQLKYFLEFKQSELKYTVDEEQGEDLQPSL